MKKKLSYIHPQVNYLSKLNKMANYLEYGVNLSDGQKTNLARAIKTGSELSLRLKNDQLKGGDELMLTKTQVNKIKKSYLKKKQVLLLKFQNHI